MGCATLLAVCLWWCVEKVGHACMPLNLITYFYFAIAVIQNNGAQWGLIDLYIVICVRCNFF